jgi:hypothetical protein
MPIRKTGRAPGERRTGGAPGERRGRWHLEVELRNRGARRAPGIADGGGSRRPTVGAHRGGRWWLAATDGGASGLRMVGARGSRQRGTGHRASAPPGVGQRGMDGTMAGGGHQLDASGWEGGEK